MTSIHPFDAATKLTPLGEGRWAGHTGKDYANFVGAFGGLVAASLLNSVVSDPRALGTPVSQTANFCAALAEGPYELHTKLQRGGKYTQHWNVELLQNQQIMATASVVCGTRKPTFSHQPAAMPDVPTADSKAGLPTGIPLEWVNRYDFRFVEGSPAIPKQPHAELRDAKAKVWISDNPPRPLDYLSLAALADCFFLRLLQVRGTMEPMGTVTLTTHFLATSEDLAQQGANPVLGTADSNRMHDHFHDQTMQLFGTDGKVLATGTQLVWFRQ